MRQIRYFCSVTRQTPVFHQSGVLLLLPFSRGARHPAARGKYPGFLANVSQRPGWAALNRSPLIFSSVKVPSLLTSAFKWLCPGANISVKQLPIWCRQKSWSIYIFFKFASDKTERQGITLGSLFFVHFDAQSLREASSDLLRYQLSAFHSIPGILNSQALGVEAAQLAVTFNAWVSCGIKILQMMEPHSRIKRGSSVTSPSLWHQVMVHLLFLLTSELLQANLSNERRSPTLNGAHTFVMFVDAVSLSLSLWEAVSFRRPLRGKSDSLLLTFASCG